MMSKSIRWQTRSKYSHAALMLSQDYMMPNGKKYKAGTVWESWQPNGVRKVTGPWDDHDPKTLVDVYGIKGNLDIVKMIRFLDRQIGMKYDFSSVFRFVSRRDTQDNHKWFCSELALAAFSKGGVDLLHIPPSHCAPGHLAWSPLTELEATIKQGDRVAASSG